MLDAAGLSAIDLVRFATLRTSAAETVTARFYSEQPGLFSAFGERGRDICREDLDHHLDFLRPVLEFGSIEPMVEYLRWVAEVLDTRGISSEHLLKSLDWLGEFFTAQQDWSGGAQVAAALQAVKTKFLEKPEFTPGMYARMPSARPEAADIESALLAGDRSKAALIMAEALGPERDVLGVELHVLQPALYGIGQKWQRNQVSVAQEHLATAIVESLMVKALMDCDAPEQNGKKVLLACVQGNRHSVGLHIVADAFQFAGWDVNYLGADVPTPALVGHARAWRPDLLCLSVSLAHQLRAARDVVAKLRELFAGAEPALLVGGLAINNFDGLADTIGADGWSPDAAAAVVDGDRLTARRAAP